MDIYRSDVLLAGSKTQRRGRSGGLRNWQKFMMCDVLFMAGGALILYDLAGWLTMLIGLSIWLLTALIILAIAGKKGRL